MIDFSQVTYLSSFPYKIREAYARGGPKAAVAMATKLGVENKINNWRREGVIGWKPDATPKPAKKAPAKEKAEAPAPEARAAA
jgi:hypothetical protein